MSNEKLLDKYKFAKSIVISEGYEEEINWQMNVKFENIDEETFLSELAWTILASNIKESIVNKNFPELRKSLYGLKNAKTIAENKDKCYDDAYKIFSSKRKISAIVDAACKINNIGFEQLKNEIQEQPISRLMVFKGIGEVTVYHLAKNIGFQVAKPDRHLIRIAKTEDYSEKQKFYSDTSKVQILCQKVSKLSGDSVPAVDYVFWRFAVLVPDYLKYFNYIEELPEGSVDEIINNHKVTDWIKF